MWDVSRVSDRNNYTVRNTEGFSRNDTKDGTGGKREGYIQKCRSHGSGLDRTFL